MKSKKQTVVTRSSAESEYLVMSHATSELLWIKYFLAELGLPYSKSMELVCDNQATMHIASNPVFHEHTKHIEVDIYFIREKVRSGVITPQFVLSYEQTADMFTKSVGPGLLQSSLHKLGLVDIFAPA